MRFRNSLGKAADKTYSTTMTIAEAIQQWVKENPKDAEAIRRSGCEITSDVLKDEKYRNIRFDAGLSSGQSAAQVFDGKFYYTVGEYNDAVAKAYGPGGKYFEG